MEGFEVSGTGTGNVEQWLSKVEKSMQETMMKQMQYAVKSFPTRALDEWILDYPQQVVITTLMLVLTNEINDILDVLQQEQELKDQVDSDKEKNSDEEDENEEAAKEEAAGEENKEGQNTERDGEKKEEEGEKVPHKKTLKGTAQIKRSPQEERTRLLGDLFGLDFHIEKDHRFTKAIEEAKDDMYKRKMKEAAANAASANAAAAAAKAAKRNVANRRPGFKEYVMEILGKQSFFGVYLRIQFWINKIIRALTEERRNDWQDKAVEMGLTGVQKMVMRNIILFLLHQRDCVDKMITLEINNRNDFE